jgi:hypothetical protein
LRRYIEGPYVIWGDEDEEEEEEAGAYTRPHLNST